MNQRTQCEATCLPSGMGPSQHAPAMKANGFSSSGMVTGMSVVSCSCAWVCMLTKVRADNMKMRRLMDLS